MKKEKRSARAQKPVALPTMEQVAAERDRLISGSRFRRTFSSTLSVLVVVAAVAILIATLWLPVLQIYGSSMSPLMEAGDIIVMEKANDFENGEVIAFYYNNKILVKRVIGGPGDWINITEDGTVYVNDQLVDEPYITDKAFGQCDIALPYQVPDEAYFVMGDHRSVSVDSRSTQIGCVRHEQIVGRSLLRLWPLSRLALLS